MKPSHNTKYFSGAAPVKHPDSNGLSNGNSSNGVAQTNGNGCAEGLSPHHSEREDMKFWENDHFRDLRKRWEKGEMEESEIALVPDLVLYYRTLSVT